MNIENENKMNLNEKIERIEKEMKIISLKVKDMNEKEKSSIIESAKKLMDSELNNVLNSQMNKDVYVFVQSKLNKIAEEYKSKYGFDPLSELSMNKPELKMVKKEN